MKPTKTIENLVKDLHETTGREMDERVIGDVMNVMKQKEKRPSLIEPNIWRKIMKTRITKLTSIAAAILIVIAGIILVDKSVTPVWAIEQTIEAFEEIHSVIITGTVNDSGPFKCWTKRNEQSENLFNMRYESNDEVVVIRGDKAYAHRPGSSRVHLFEKELSIHGLAFWYKAMELRLWLTGTMFQQLKEQTDDWKETYGKDEQTGRKCVFVTCSYKPLSGSFWFVFDPETKLVVRVKHWFNVNREGEPAFYAENIVYNEEISDEVFDFKIPEGAKVVNEKDLRQKQKLREKARKLFENKEYAEALELYHQAEYWMMVGICYDNMEQFEKAIEYYEKNIEEYSDVPDSLLSTYFYLGSAYVKTGQNDKAIEAFKNCLITGEGVRGSDEFPLKNAREYLKKLESEK